MVVAAIMILGVLLGMYVKIEKSVCYRWSSRVHISTDAKRQGHDENDPAFTRGGGGRSVCCVLIVVFI